VTRFGAAALCIDMARINLTIRFLAVTAALSLSACTTTGMDGGNPAGDDDDDDLVANPDGGGAPNPDPDAPDGGGGPIDPPPPGSGRIVGYFTAWSVYGRNYHVADIQADRLTHINYAFANISASGECALGDPYADIDKFYDGDSWDTGALRGSFHQLQKLKQAHPHLRTLISVGGWTWSAHFSDVALTDASRQKFAASCVAFMDQYGFDGIDIDWEYPVGGGLASNTYRPEDRHNYTLLMRELRRQLDELGSARGAHYLLTIAAPAGPGTYAHLEIGELAAALDWINLMTYDFHGSWDPITNFNAPLEATTADPSSDPDVRAHFNVASAVEGYLAGGAPADKIVVGVPFYGRGWQGVANVDHGLYQSHTGVPMGTWEAGVFDYSDIAANYVPSYTRYFHEEAKVPWLYDPATGIMISYDDPDSLGRKAAYVRDRGLGGVMFWELSGDDDAGALLGALNAELRP